MSELPIKTLIIHGWSDDVASFRKMKAFILRHIGGDVDTVLYASYQSREDLLTFDDIVDGLHQQMQVRGLVDGAGKPLARLNIIVHSTGALVIRHWIWRYYVKHGNRMADCPVQRLIMLAPANFGSPLAHRGKSFLGALAKGRKSIGNFLEVGQEILAGLELGSPFQWALAHRDLLIDAPYFNAHQIQTTVLVGIEPYPEWKGLFINKPGTDGAVVIAGTSLDTAKLTLDFSETVVPSSIHGRPYRWDWSNATEDVAFGVLQGCNHSSIITVEALGRMTPVGAYLLRALQCASVEAFASLQQELQAVTVETYAKTKKPCYQQFLIHTADDHGRGVTDFNIEFFVYAKPKSATAVIRREALSVQEVTWSMALHREITKEFHTYMRDSSYRRFLVDLQAVEHLLKQASRELGPVVLAMKLYVPAVDKGIYYDNHALQRIIIYDPQIPKGQVPQLFYPNTTTLIELRVNRVIDKRYVELIR